VAKVIKIDGSERDLYDVGLESLQQAVGGYIQIVPTNDGRWLVLDEEGKLKEKQVNRKGTELTRGIVDDSDFIVGDVVVANKDEIN